MAEPVGIVASAITMGAAAAQLSLALFKVAQTFKHAPGEISDIATEMSTLSDTLMLLSDLLPLHEGICKPELLQHIRSTLDRIETIKEQLIHLTSAKTKLRRLKWFFDAPKAKSMLKKVESIKTALILMLNILKLATEQSHGTPQNVQSTQLQRSDTLPHPNRFRKVAESAVQLSRRAIVKAEEENAHQPTEKRRKRNYQLNRYEADFHDTATWLYHLVFTHITSTQRHIEPHVATVEDYDSESSMTNNLDSEMGIRSPSPVRDMDLIVWNDETEPGIVVDRLLQSWTTISPRQIEDSAAYWNQIKDEKWREALVKRVEEYTKQRNPHHRRDRERSNPSTDLDYGGDSAIFSDASASSSEEQFQDAQMTIPQSVPDPPPLSPHIYSTPRVRFEESSSDSDAAAPQTPPSRGKHRSTPYIPSHQGPWENANLSEMQPGPSTGIFNSPYHPSMTNPFDPMWSAPQPFAPLSQPPPAPQPAPQTPPKVPPIIAPQPTHPKRSDEDSDIAKLEALLAQASKQAEERAADRLKSRLDRLETVFSQQTPIVQMPIQEEYASELPKQLSDDIYQNRLNKLEKLLIEQGADQLRRHVEAEAIWKAEKAESDAKASRAAEESRALMEKELAAAQGAKKAAEKALKFAKEQAANRARREAEAKAADERRMIDEDYRKRIDKYEEQLSAFTRAWKEAGESQDRNSTPIPMRRTLISKGDQQIEVSEFGKNRLEPLTIPQFTSGTIFQEEYFDTDANTTKNYEHSQLGHRRQDSSYSWSDSKSFAKALPSSEIVRAAPNKILLPAQLDMTSTRTHQMQSSLNRCGIPTEYDGSSYNYSDGNIVARHNAVGDELIRSTVFWEPPLLTLGSELLSTLRLRGWRPFYVRVSSTGRTYFLGNQPIHVHFFGPEYKPQLKASSSFTDLEHIEVAKDLVEEYALLELGLEFSLTSSGAYALDCRLTANDVEALIDRSFMIRETGYRRQHRLLHWKIPYAGAAGSSDEEYEPSLTSEATSASEESRDTSLHREEIPLTSPMNDRVVRIPPWEATPIGVYQEAKANAQDIEIPSAASTCMEGDGQVRLRPGKGKEHQD